MSRTTSSFSDSEIVIARTGFVTNLDGVEVLVVDGSRHRGGEPVVAAHPQLFVADGFPVTPPEPPEQPELEPPPPPDKPRMLRTTKPFSSGQRSIPGSFGTPERFTLTLVAGALIPKDSPYLAALSKGEMREYFEEIEES